MSAQHVLDAEFLAERVTRRRALQMAVAAAALAAAPGLLRLKGGVPAFLRRSTFVPLLGERFMLRSPDGRSESVQLSDVHGLQGARGARTPEDGAFSLLFTGVRTQAPVQGTYMLAHPKLGRFRLFLVPVGRGVKVQEYEAVVNRVPY